MDKSLVKVSTPVVLERLKRPSEFPPEEAKTSVGDVNRASRDKQLNYMPRI